MNAVIENYEFISAITTQMREAAVLNQWDQLVELEKQCSQRVAAMKEVDQNTSLDETSRLKKVALIRKILADDAEIRNQTEPWMAQLQRIMQSAQKEQRLLEAYSAS
jgi:flagellar protein FliT